MSKIINLHAIKQRLQEQRFTLLERLDTKDDLDRSIDLLNPDQADRAMSYRDNNRETLLLDHARQQLHDIDQALARLDADTYGKCIECGQNIQPERLEIMPSAALCIDCQRLHDR